VVFTETEEKGLMWTECMPYWKALLMMFGGIGAWILGIWLEERIKQYHDK